MTKTVQLTEGVGQSVAERIVAIVQAGSSGWQNAFNVGDAVKAASYYEQDALMVAKPFGEQLGSEAIQSFWRHIISEGFSDVEYIDPIYTVLSDDSVRIESAWRMNKAAGIITNELWVVQDNDTALMREDHFEIQS